MAQSLNKNKKIILFIVGIIILLIIIFLIFISKPKPVPPSPPEVYTKLIPVDSTINIELNDGDFFRKVSPALNGQEGRIIEIKVIQNGKVLNLKELASLLGINIPDYVKEVLVGKYTLIGFPSSFLEKRRLGLVLNFEKGEDIVLTNFKKWEPSMVNDLFPLFLNAQTSVPPSNVSFKDGNYGGAKIRYFNFPDSELDALDYALVNDIIIISTSKENNSTAINLYQAIQVRFKDCQCSMEPCHDENCPYFSFCQSEGEYEICRVCDCGKFFGIIIDKKKGEEPHRFIKSFQKQETSASSEKQRQEIRNNCKGSLEIIEQKCEDDKFIIKAKVTTKGKCKIYRFVAKTGEDSYETFEMKRTEEENIYILTSDYCLKDFDLFAVGEMGLAIKAD